VGDHFAGREKELKELSDYFGVRRSGSVLEWVRRQARGVAGFLTEPPLMVWGAGGIGKSSLLAKFVLDHVDLEGPQMPFAYLDFDRAAIEPEDPATLLVEAARQLAVQAPEGRDEWDARRRSWAASVGGEDLSRAITKGEAPRKSTDRGAQARIIGQFAETLEATFPAEVPFLLVLDTFEEVQYRSRAYVGALWDFLEALQEKNYRLRTVIAGRAPIADRDTKDLEMSMLDDRAAEGYLRFRGIEDEETASFIVSRFGGNPLTLRLAADLVQQDEGGVQSLQTVKGRHKIFKLLSKGQETIQRALYRRILDHIHDEKVRALAHPGLTLRRITSDLIAEVLVEPCGIEIQSPAEADDLMEGLRREISLVRPADGGAVEHRSDLRRLMLPMLYQDHPAKVREIHHGAVAYYFGRDTLADRAEEIYHRLARGDEPAEVDARWIEGVDVHLFNAVPELSAQGQAYLAPRVGVELDDEVLKKASRRDREIEITRRARDLLAVGDAVQALKLLQDAAKEWGPGGPLDVLLATAQYRIGDLHGALETIDRALEELPSDVESRLVLELQELAARIEQDEGRLEQAADRLEEAYPVARWFGEVTPALALGVRWLSLTREVDPAGVRDVAVKVYEVLERLPDDDLLKADPELAWALAGELGETYPAVVGRVGRAVAFPVDLPAEGLSEVLQAWAEHDKSAAALSPDETQVSARRGIAALFSLLSSADFPADAAAIMARLLRERRPDLR
jgi:tetratricopeptide (TPR) repeat protein